MSGRGPRRLNWGLPEEPPPKHPYRDTLLVYGGLAIVVVVVAWATGGPVGKAAIVAALFFVVATVWSSWRWRERIHEERRREEKRRAS